MPSLYIYVEMTEGARPYFLPSCQVKTKRQIGPDAETNYSKQDISEQKCKGCKNWNQHQPVPAPAAQQKQKFSEISV